MWSCKHCREKIENQFDACWSCGHARDGTPPESFESIDQAAGELEQELSTEHPYADIPIATVNSIGGKKIIATVDVVSAECVFGVNIFRDIFASVRNFVGGRSASYQKVLKDAKATCFCEIRKEAFALGANAVIGLQLDYSSISPSGDAGSLLMLVVTGTAVIVENEKDAVAN